MYQYQEELTRLFVLSRISEEDIFFKYLGIYPNMTDYFRNPLRPDSTADCRFYRDSRQVLKFNDFAYKMNLDCFNVVSRLHNNANFNEVLKIIAEDFNLFESDINYSLAERLETFKKDNKSQYVDMKVQRRDFTKWDLEFWQKNGWSLETLKIFKVSPLLRAWINGNQMYTYSSKDPGYVYFLGNDELGRPHYKLYFPLRDRYKFIQNIGDAIQGLEQLPEHGDFLIITKSYKDVGCMFNYDLPSIAPMGETVLLSDEQFEDLNNRFFKIFTLFDRDRAGMIGSQLYRKRFGTIPLLFDARNNQLFRNKTDPKDFTDHHIDLGIQEMLDIINYTKEEYS